jgi:hypothetical protein
LKAIDVELEFADLSAYKNHQDSELECSSQALLKELADWKPACVQLLLMGCRKSMTTWGRTLTLKHQLRA